MKDEIEGLKAKLEAAESRVKELEKIIIAYVKKPWSADARSELQQAALEVEMRND